MKRRLALVLATMAWAAGIAVPSVEAAPLLFIRGRVKSVTGEALIGARVSTTSRAVITTQEGRYELGVDIPGCYQVTASGVTPNGAFESSTREICVTTQDALHEDFSLSLVVTADASPRLLSIRAESGPRIEAAVYCPPVDCELEAEIRRSSASGPLVATVPLETATTSNEFWLYSGEVAIHAVSADALYVTTVTARHIDSGVSASRCLGNRCMAAFTVDGQPPSIQLVGDGWEKSSTPALVLNYSDPAGIAPKSITVLVDGTIVPWTRHGGLTAGQISFNPAMGEGSHVVDVHIADSLANQGAYRSNVWVDLTTPTVGDTQPEGRITTRSPTIQAVIEDAPFVESILPASIRLRLSNGLLSADLAAVFEPVSGRVTYTVPSSLQGPSLGSFPLPDGDYVVELNASDAAGNVVSRQWAFTVDVLPPRVRQLLI